MTAQVAQSLVLQKQVPLQESSQAEPLWKSHSALLRMFEDTFLLGGDWQLPSEQLPLLHKAMSENSSAAQTGAT